MAKRALLDVLSSTIGRYVRDLDEEKLNVAVWSGKIELSNLALDTDAVNAELARQAREAPNLAIPLRVVEGRFDTLKVEVPWARITSRPVVVRAAGLKVVVEPHSNLTGKQHEYVYDGGVNSSVVSQKSARDIRGAVLKRKRESREHSLKFADESRRRANAVRKLAALDNDDRPKATAAASASVSEMEGATFAGRLVRRIAENLQLDFESVHVSLKGCGCSAGVVLGSVSFFTTDASGERTFVDRSVDDPNGRKNRGNAELFLYKELEIEGLGIYCDEDEVSPLERMQQHLTSTCRAGGAAAPSIDHSYILSPLSFTCRLRRSDMLRCVDFPKYLITSELRTVSIMLSRSQLELARKITESVAAKNDAIRPLFPEYRPPLSVSKATAKEWWLYALRCIGRLNRRRCWVEFFIAFQKRKKYIALYKRSAHHVSCSWLSKLTIGETAEMDELEQDQTISPHGIMCWRNVADAQVERENQKHSDAIAAKGGGGQPRQKKPLASIFGRSGNRQTDSIGPVSTARSARGVGSGHGSSDDKDDIPPIQLSAEEMQELEAMTMNVSVEESALSADSILCNISFVLGSFRVNLVSYGLQALTSLQMGTVRTNFEANADGSFESRLTMSSLSVDDLVTARSLFPRVVRSLQTPIGKNGAMGSFNHALDFSYDKSKIGDKTFVLKMVAYEVVASSSLLKEVVDFFAVRSVGLTRVGLLSTPQKRNPILEASMTGSVDLFYDADHGESQIIPSSELMTPHAQRNPPTTAMVSDRLAAALADAWNSKTKSKRAWTIECDIHAPILVIPESCVDREAPVLIFDLGSFNLVYGRSEPCPEVQQWFDDNPIWGSDESTLDHCTVEVRRLSFAVSKAGWTQSLSPLSVTSKSDKPKETASTVIEPITLSLKIGIEGSKLSLNKSRKCVYGILPHISIQLSPVAVNSILSTYSKWVEFIEGTLMATDASMKKRTRQCSTLLEDTEDDSSAAGGIEILASDNENSATMTAAPPLETFLVDGELQAKDSAPNDEPFQYLHFSLALRKLSTTLSIDGTSGLEAHLVSVELSSAISTDGSSSNRCRMGWFWVLDRLRTNRSRKQRMVAHSLLPRPASEYAQHDSYDILADLTRLGGEEHSSSSDLADIVVTKSIETGSSPQATELLQIDATFTSLFINWNPGAIKNIVNQRELFHFNKHFQSMGSSSKTSFDTRSSLFAVSSQRRQVSVRARMNSLSVSLNSAIDDLPLYVLKMAGAEGNASVSYLVADPTDQEIDASVIVGDIKMETSATGRALNDYTAIIGLAPTHSTSLLTVQYKQGKESMASCGLDGFDKEKYFSYAEIDISPVRFVYIQAQILILTEYVTEGVLGAIFAKVAASAAAAAMEMARTAENSDKLFQINARGLDLVVPQACSSENYFVINAGDLDVQYVALANDQGGKAKCSISDVTLTCDRKLPMLDEPIQMSVDVFLSAVEGETEEDRAIKVNVEISQASFMLTRRHYGQIMDTLDTNISEEYSFLREDNSHLFIREEPTIEKVEELQQLQHLQSLSSSLSKTTPGLITHGGVDLVVVQRHLYVQVSVAKLGVHLCKEDTNATIVSLAAVKTDILLRLLPEQDKIWSKVTLHDLVCEDRRPRALSRRFQHLISCQKDVEEELGSISSTNDVFCVTYEKDVKNEMTCINLTIGSLQVVVIPDCIVEVVEFLKAGIRPPTAVRAAVSTIKTRRRDESSDMESKAAAGSSQNELDALSTNVTVTRQRMKANITTSNCRLVLVDMGSAPGVEGAPLTKSLKNALQLTETIVVQGKIESVLDFTSDINTGEIVNSDHQLHGDHIEIYTAQGVELLTPVQILEPSVFSVFLSKASLEGGERQEIDVNAVTLSHIEVILSMQNIALINAIISSITDSLLEAEARKEDKSEEGGAHVLSDNEKWRIERLASALDKTDDVDIERSSHPEETNSVIEGSYHRAGSNVASIAYAIRVKATIPETILTVVNDLQGLDDALFKLLFKNFVFGGEFDFPSAEDSLLPQFRFHVNTAIVSNYFDTNSLLWESLLLKPWELQFNGMRAPQKRFSSNRMSTSFDVDSHPCYLSFSEQFLVSIGAASRMWSVYSSALQKAIDYGKASEGSSVATRRSLAACAARSLITTMPYGLENHSGVVAHFSTRFGSHEESCRVCPSGKTRYFQFEPSPGEGTGGKRLYGQDVLHVKTLDIDLGNSTIRFEHVDAEINRPRKAHLLGNGLCVFTQVLRDMKATVVHISSHVDIINSSPIPLGISVKTEQGIEEVGVCAAAEAETAKRLAPQDREGNTLSHCSAGFGIPITYLRSLSHSSPSDTSKPSTTIVVSPLPDRDNDMEGRLNLSGEVVLPSLASLVQVAMGNSSVQSFEVSCTSTCSPEKDRKSQDAMVLQVCCRVSLVQSYYPFVELFFQPRALLSNNLPVRIVIRTPMSHTFSSCSELLSINADGREESRDLHHFLDPFESIKILSPGPSIAIAVLCADQPTGGRRTGWMQGSLVDLPLDRNAPQSEPHLCLFPFVKRQGEPAAIARGSEFLILEGSHGLLRDDTTSETSLHESDEARRSIDRDVEALRANDPSTHVKKFCIIVHNYAVDHTGDILFEQVAKSSPTSPTRSSFVTGTSVSPQRRRSFHPTHLAAIPFSAFSSSFLMKRITLLPASDIPIRILKLTMEGDEGTKRSAAFAVEDIPLSEGGIESRAISWDDNKTSNYYAYRRLSLTNQYELHVIPEFVIYNGSTAESILVKQPGNNHTSLDPGGVAPLHSDSGPTTDLILMIEFVQSAGSTSPIKVDSLGIKICVVRSSYDGRPIGSVAIQTVIGGRDSRLVVKVGALKYATADGLVGLEETFADDFFRFRIRWSEMEVTLIDTQKAIGASYGENRDALEAALGITPRKNDSEPVSSDASFPPYKNVAQFLLHRFTVDYQRIFKDEETIPTGTGTTSATLSSLERTQLAIIIHSVRITDCDSSAVSPIVLESSPHSHFFDLCIRTRGSHSADLIKVDLLDLNIAFSDGKADPIVISTGEDFLWRLFDVASRTMEATAALAGIEIQLKWDAAAGTFVVSTVDTATTADRQELDSTETYRPPQSDKMYDVRTARVSPISLLVSFKRQPERSRYQLVRGVRGAKLMNYVTTRLKFTVDKADIRFAGYIARNVKGPSDRLIEMVVAVYSSRLKFKLVTLLNSVTLQDWRYLSGREYSGDEYVEGDLLRLTGNLAGRSAGYVLKKVGQGLGDGVSSFTGSIGDEIQRSSERVGAGAVGASVNSVVSGLGDGVGSSIKGVGAGSGKLFRGAGKGIGQVVGGVGGGVLLAAKGIGKGITTGDGGAVLSGLGDGLSSMGTGIGRGVETTALGATDGVLTAGQGLVSGVGSIGRGIGGAFRGGPASSAQESSNQYHEELIERSNHQQQQQQPQQPQPGQRTWRPGDRIRERRERWENIEQK
mmetsp:Transcript_10115/g.22639  ORF Transcript_10115/g.22639 Transcript_10115/m.22639 type:complete len:3425 (-) Transcript_10115:94-10368(-)